MIEMGEQHAANPSTVTPKALANFALQYVTNKIAGSDGILSYSFKGFHPPALTRSIEKALTRVDAQLDIDLQRDCSCKDAEVNIVEFAATQRTDPVTGQTNWNVGKATPNNTSWTIFWSDTQDFTGVSSLDVIIHEWGHVLGLEDADSHDPLRTETTSAETVMSYSRVKNDPGHYFRALDVEALTLLWGPETSAPEHRAPLVDANNPKDASSFAWEVHGLLETTASNADFLSGAYITILERAIDSNGASWWTTQLEQGLSRRAVVDTLLLSTEFLELLG